jgi:hypothetical protein
MDPRSSTARESIGPSTASRCRNNPSNEKPPTADDFKTKEGQAMKKQFQSPAVNKANSLFKKIPEKAKTDYEKAQEAFHANRERLKAERLAREAERRSKRDRAS